MSGLGFGPIRMSNFGQERGQVPSRLNPTSAIGVVSDLDFEVMLGPFSNVESQGQVLDRVQGLIVEVMS